MNNNIRKQIVKTPIYTKNCNTCGNTNTIYNGTNRICNICNIYFMPNIVKYEERLSFSTK
jgi:hypothetical protein